MKASWTRKISIKKCKVGLFFPIAPTRCVTFFYGCPHPSIRQFFSLTYLWAIQTFFELENPRELGWGVTEEKREGMGRVGDKNRTGLLFGVTSRGVAALQAGAASRMAAKPADLPSPVLPCLLLSLYLTRFFEHRTIAIFFNKNKIK